MRQGLLTALLISAILSALNAQVVIDGTIKDGEWDKADFKGNTRAGDIYVVAGPTSLKIALDGHMCEENNAVLSGVSYKDEISVIIDADNNKNISAADHEFSVTAGRGGASMIKTTAGVSGWHTGSQLPSNGKAEYSFSATNGHPEAHQCWEIEIPVADFKMSKDSMGFAIRILTINPVLDIKLGAESEKKYLFFLKKVSSSGSISFATYKAVNNGNPVRAYGQVGLTSIKPPVSKETLQNRYAGLKNMPKYTGVINNFDVPSDSMVVMSHSMAPTPPLAPQASQSVQDWLAEVDFSLYFMILGTMTDNEKIKNLDKEMDSYNNSYERITRQVAILKNILNRR